MVSVATSLWCCTASRSNSWRCRPWCSADRWEPACTQHLDPRPAPCRDCCRCLHTAGWRLDRIPRHCGCPSGGLRPAGKWTVWPAIILRDARLVQPAHGRAEGPGRQPDRWPAPGPVGTPEGDRRPPVGGAVALTPGELEMALLPLSPGSSTAWPIYRGYVGQPAVDRARDRDAAFAGAQRLGYHILRPRPGAGSVERERLDGGSVALAVAHVLRRLSVSLHRLRRLGRGRWVEPGEPDGTGDRPGGGGSRCLPQHC